MSSSLMTGGFEADGYALPNPSGNGEEDRVVSQSASSMAAVRQRRQQKDAADASTLPSSAFEEGVKKTRKAAVPKLGLVVLAFVVFHAAVFATIAHFHTWLPEPEALDAPSDRFSEARARIVLEKIMSFGYRPVGSEANDVLTPAYLVSEIEAIKSAAPEGVSIEIDIQKPTGAFGLDFLAQFQNIYANVTNIVVRVASTAPDAVDVLENSLMISSHYDAAIGGGAASDDGVNIAIMMEVLRFFANQPPKYGSLVFNFNGAEETIMQGAHGFITQHPWTKNIRAFINLEAAGAGGRELLFQTGSDELALAYSEGAKYPHASIIAQELFQSGVIPADTDFRVYRDFGAVAGMDFAYIANGYVYHTPLDDISRIQQGAIQRLGENVVGIIERLDQPGRLSKVASTPQNPNTLFFDVGGLFMISTSKPNSFMLCGAVVLLAVLFLLQSPITHVERVAALKLVGKCVGTGLGASVFTAVVLTLFAPMSWYSNPYIGAAVFLTPALAAMVNTLAKFLKRKQVAQNVLPDSLWRIEASMFEAMLSVWLFGLLALLALNFISSYIMAVWVFFPLMGQVACSTLRRLKLLPPALYLLISLAAIAIPVVHTGFVLALAFMFFIPLMGRCGPQPPPDILIAVVFGLSLMVMFSYSSRFFCFVSPKKLFNIRDILIVISIFMVVLSTFINPYSDITPKRLMIQHVHREVQHANGSVVAQDSGIWVSALDYRGLEPVRPFLASTRWSDATLMAPPKALMDKMDLYGDLPWGLPVRQFLPERYSWYLPTTAPAYSEGEYEPRLDVVSSHYDAAINRRKIHLHFTGPSHLDIFVDATKTRLTSWSIGGGVDGPAPHSDGTYILHFATGMAPASFHFWIEAEGNEGIDIAVVGHELEMRTPPMSEFLAALPSWIQPNAFVSSWTSRTI